MITLFDGFDRTTQDLHYSLRKSGFLGVGVVLQDDGFLPDDLTSPYSYFCKMESGDGRARYFNEVPVPDYWQITGTNLQGEIWNLDEKKATIYYKEPKHLRLVKAVDWLTPKQKVYRTDHYNQYGWIYAKTYFNEEEQAVCKRYFQESGHEVLIEYFKNEHCFLNWEGRVFSFERRSDFLSFYLKEAGLDTSAIWYNSLSTPFALSYYMEEEGKDILFWQEKARGDIPGNMQLIFSGSASRTKQIIVQDKKSYEQFCKLLPLEQQDKLLHLGYIYPSKSENHNRKSILILTNSDQIEGLDVLAEGLKDYHFHIAALTEMSAYLMSYDDHEHISLYPNVAHWQVDQLFEECNIYLDINHGSEILDAVRQAFEHNLVLATFTTTAHQSDFVLEEAQFLPDKVNLMVEWIVSQKDLSQVAQRQRKAGGQATIEDYQSLLKLKGGKHE